MENMNGQQTSNSFSTAQTSSFKNSDVSFLFNDLPFTKPSYRIRCVVKRTRQNMIIVGIKLQTKLTKASINHYPNNYRTLSHHSSYASLSSRCSRDVSICCCSR